MNDYISKPSIYFKILTEKPFDCYNVTVHSHLSYIPKYALSCFLNSFESQPLLLRAVPLRGSQFSQSISQHFTAPCHYYYRRFNVVIQLSSFVEDSENTEPGVKNCYNIFLAIHGRLSSRGYARTSLTF